MVSHLSSVLASLEVEHPSLGFFRPTLVSTHQGPRGPFLWILFRRIDKLVQPETFDVSPLGALSHGETLDQARERLFQLLAELGDVAQRVIRVVIRRLQGGQVERVDRRARDRGLRGRRSFAVFTTGPAEERLKQVRVDQRRARVEVVWD